MLNSLLRKKTLAMAPIKLLMLFYTSLLFFTESIAQQESDKLVAAGLQQCYNFKWEKAEQTFHKIIEKYPTDPVGYHYISSIYFWYFLSSKSENDFNLFKKYSDEAIDKALDRLEKKNDDADLLYLLGSNYNYRTVAFAKAESYIDAVWAAKKSESYLSECLKSDSSVYDAYLGLGLYNFAVANIPSGFKWALNLAGISGEENTGLNFIRIAVNKGKSAKVEAQYYLSQILTEALMDFEAASGYLKQLIKKYPDNLLFNYSHAVVEIKRRNLNEAEKILLKLVEKEDLRFLQIISFSNFLLGDIYFRRNDFETAKQYYSHFLTTTGDNDYSGIASYRLALSNEITGHRKEAEKYFALSAKGNMDIEDDIFAKRKGNIYLKRTLAETESEVIKSANLVEAGMYQQAIDTLVNLLSDVKTEKLRAEIYLLISEAAFYLNRFDESVDYALNAVKFNLTDEEWIKPFGYYYCARASKEMGDILNSKKYISQAEDYSGYDYQKKLEQMIKALQRNL